MGDDKVDYGPEFFSTDNIFVSGEDFICKQILNQSGAIIDRQLSDVRNGENPGEELRDIR